MADNNADMVAKGRHRPGGKMPRDFGVAFRGGEVKRWHISHSEHPDLKKIGHGHVFIADAYNGCTDLDCNKEHVAVVPWEQYLAMLDDHRKAEAIRRIIEQERPVLDALAAYDAGDLEQ